MKTQLLAIFLVAMVAVSNAAQLQMKLQSKSNIVNDIQDKNSQFYALLEEGSQFIVDEVLSLLQNLEDAARKDLSNLNAAWQKEKHILEGIVQSARKAWLVQQQKCNGLEAQQHELENKIKTRQDESNRNVRQIKEDGHKIQVMKAERCKANNLYIDHIVDHRDALLLFQVLRKAIEGYQPGSFIQLSKFKENVATLGDFINIYAQQHSQDFQGIMSQLRQIRIVSRDQNDDEDQVDSKFQSQRANAKVNNYAGNKQYQQVDRVQERINIDNKHVDNNKGQIKLQDLNQNTVRSLANVKGQLLKILDEITLVEQQKKKTQEIEESNSNEAAATFKSQLQDEQRKLTRRNEVLKVEIAQLKVRLHDKILEVNACRTQEGILLVALKQAQKNLEDAAARYRARKSVLEQEIVLFSRLYLYYKTKVYAVATKADRERIQDHVDNHNFKKSASYTYKSASRFNGLHGKVFKNLHAEAEAAEAGLA